MFDVVASRKRLARFSRWGLIAVVVLMAAALMATAWSTNRAVSGASDTLLRGQAEAFRTAVPRGRAPDRDLEDTLAEHAEDGLRYIAVFNRGGQLVAKAGESVVAADDVSTGASKPARIDGRARVVFGAPGPERKRRSRRNRRPGIIVIEFEPRVADQLESTARTTLGIGGLAGVALLLFAAALVRWYQLEQARERALEHERRLASLGQMSAVLAHEIRNPIASLKGNAQLLVKMIPDEGKPRAKAERVVQESVRLETLTNDLLEFARAGQLDIAPADPTAVLRDAAATLDADRIDIDATDAPATWKLDAGRMRQVLANLLDNALHAGDGRVHARIERTDGLTITVRDHGDGIPSADLEHVFEPFYTRRTHGTGLGLAVSRRIVELHGGTLTAANHPDGGALLRITLP